MDVVAAIDIGTSSVRASLFDTQGNPVTGSFSQRTHQARTGPGGEATLDADEVVADTVACLKEITSRGGIRVLGVGTATFWHSLLGVDGEGRACTPIYLWSDVRSSSQVETLRRRLDERAVHARTGCLFHTSYFPARLLWLKESDPAAFDRVTAWVSPGEYLYLRLSGKPLCSLSVASGTGLLDQNTFRWDRELLEFLGVAEEKLSPLVDVDVTNTGLKAPYTTDLPTLAGAPWFPPVGDGAASNLGSGASGPGRVALMIGTSGAMRLLGMPETPPPWGLWKYRLDRKRCLVGGALSNGGAVYHWLTATLKLPERAELEQWLANAEPDSHGLTVLPFLLGERSPDWYVHATGAILGLTAATTPLQLFQASLEAVAYRFRMVHDLLGPLADPGHVLVGSGAGLSHSRAWAQMITDAIGRPMVLSAEPEATSRGVALLILEQLDLLAGAASATGAAASDTLEGVRLEPDAGRYALYSRGMERHRETAARWMGPGEPGGPPLFSPDESHHL